jgi:hypothetical protein
VVGVEVGLIIGEGDGRPQEESPSTTINRKAGRRKSCFLIFISKMFASKVPGFNV